MLGNMYQRLGDEHSASPSSAGPFRSTWGRGIYSDSGFASNSHAEGGQVGTDLWANGNWRTGAYTGYLTGGSGNSTSYLGAYATWKDASGLYVDGVLQGGRRRYGDSSLAVSVEVGKPFALSQDWSVEPQAQLAYQDHGSGWTGRLGGRVKGDFITGAGRLQPYVSMNVYDNNTDAETVASSTRWGAAVGATLSLTSATKLYGEVGALRNVAGDSIAKSSIQGSLGMKTHW
ncbi:hypothetical protein H4CHR_05618 [Variovorax sp. PBS-H4]|nr:hypothetical protein H4CHR_05618 [Variovorax sp. PBS-H4]